jgi:hypothetical protein
MKFRLKQWKTKIGRTAMAVAFAFAVVHSGAAQDDTNAPVRIVSVFEDFTKAGNTDPFFPMSHRIPNNQRQTPTAQAAPTQVQAVAIDQIRLQGVILGAQEKTVLINNKTLAEGESVTLKLSKGAPQVQIHVIEIRPRSAVIKIDGDPEPKEIYLRPF